MRKCENAPPSGSSGRLSEERSSETLNRSQTWLAREASISPSYLSSLVNEGRAPSGPVRRRLQAALGISDFDELFELEDRDENE